MIAVARCDVMLRTARSYTHVPVFEGDTVQVVALGGGGRAETLVRTSGGILARVPFGSDSALQLVDPPAWAA